MKFRSVFLDFYISKTRINVKQILTYISDIVSAPQGVLPQNLKDLPHLLEWLPKFEICSCATDKHFIAGKS